MGKVASAFDQLESRTGNGCAIRAPVRLGQYAVVRSPQDQCRNADTVEASSQLGIMHVGRRGIPRGRFWVAGGGQNLRVGHRLVVVATRSRIEILKLKDRKSTGLIQSKS